VDDARTAQRGELKSINLRGTGIDLVAAANQPHNRFLRKMSKP
jgi:hypothetical protein